MTRAGRVFGDRLRAERRRFELFRKGIVVEIDQTTVPWMATISDGHQSRRMPYIQATLEVGDVVQWVDQTDPFTWGKADPPPGLDGGAEDWFPDAYGRASSFVSTATPTWDQDASNEISFTGPISRSTGFGGFRWETGYLFAGGTIYSGAAYATIDYVRVNGMGASPSYSGFTAPDLGNVQYELDRLDSGSFAFVSGGPVGANDIPGLHLHWSDPTKATRPHFYQKIVKEIVGIDDRSAVTGPADYAAGSRIYWPEMTSPGPNWPLAFMIAIQGTDSPPGQVDLTFGTDNGQEYAFENLPFLSTTFARTLPVAFGGTRFADTYFVFMKPTEAGSWTPYVDVATNGIRAALRSFRMIHENYLA